LTESAFTHTSAREVERERERERERESKTKNVFSKYAYKQLILLHTTRLKHTHKHTPGTFFVSRHERKQGVLE